jgi:hypothetical protein
MGNMIMKHGLQMKMSMIDELQELLESEPLKSHVLATPEEQAEYKP